VTAEELTELLRAALPVTTNDVRLDCVDVKREPGAGFVATLRLFTYDNDSVRDIKEQDVVIVRRDQADDARIPVYIAAWGAALARAFVRRGVGGVETVMPHDLVFPRVLELKKAITQADFEKAFDAKSRLG
jgi:hypothetical protein